MGNNISKIVASFKNLSLQLKSEVIEPFCMFSENFKLTIEVPHPSTQSAAKKATDTISDL